MEPITIVNIAGSLISILVQIIHKHFYTKGFRESFKKFKETLDKNAKEKAEKEIVKLNKNIKNIQVQEIIDISRKLADDLEEQNAPAISYLEVHKRIKFFYLFAIGSIFLSLLSFKVTKLGQYITSDVGFTALIISVLMLFWMIWDLYKLEEQVIKLEFGIPISKILGKDK